MSTFELDTRELDQLARELGKAPEYKRQEAGRVVQQVGAETQRAAQAAAPKDRPWLSRSGIRRKTWRPTDGLHVDIFTAPDPAAKGNEQKRNVGFYIEYGTSDTPPQPFLGPQVPGAQEKLVERLGDVLDPFRRFPAAEIPDD